jgi:hypothetical protein
MADDLRQRNKFTYRRFATRAFQLSASHEQVHYAEKVTLPEGGSGLSAL